MHFAIKCVTIYFGLFYKHKNKNVYFIDYDYFFCTMIFIFFFVTILVMGIISLWELITSVRSQPTMLFIWVNLIITIQYKGKWKINKIKLRISTPIHSISLSTKWVFNCLTNDVLMIILFMRVLSAHHKLDLLHRFSFNKNIVRPGKALNCSCILYNTFSSI